MTILEIIENIVFYAALYVLLWNAYFLTVNKGIPNIKTAPAIRAEIIKRLRKEMEARACERFTIVDPGCGNGDFTRQIAKEIPKAHVIGVEVSKLAYLRCCFMKRVAGLKNLEYQNADFRKSDALKEADAVCMFLLGTLMKSIREALEEQLKDGAYVTSNKFPVGGDWVPEEEIEVDTLYPHQKKFYIYRYTKNI